MKAVTDHGTHRRTTRPELVPACWPAGPVSRSRAPFAPHAAQGAPAWSLLWPPPLSLQLQLLLPLLLIADDADAPRDGDPRTCRLCARALCTAALSSCSRSQMCCCTPPSPRRRLLRLPRGSSGWWVLGACVRWVGGGEVGGWVRGGGVCGGRTTTRA